MKKIIFILLAAISIQQITLAQFQTPRAISEKVLNVPPFSGVMNNYGNLNSYNIPNPTGILWGTNSYNQIVYDQGIWVIGKIQNKVHLSFNEWLSSYSPGPILDGTAAMISHPEDSTRYRVYKISKGDNAANNIDYAEWPSDYGAPLKNGKPFLHGDQTLWTLYNADDDSAVSNIPDFQGQDTLFTTPLEVQQLAYAKNISDTTNPLHNVIFFEYKIINRGNTAIDSAYIGFWTDIDFPTSDGILTNFPAVDTTNQLGYCWDGSNGNINNHYAVGYKLLYGPITNSPGDTAIFEGKKFLDKKNMLLSSFHGIADDAVTTPLFAPAHQVSEAWNIANGFDTDGNTIDDYVSGIPTKFPFSGDPVSNSGWTYNKFPGNNVGGGAGFVMFSGPFNFAAQDSQWVMLALMPVKGTDNLDAVSKLYAKASSLDNIKYEDIITDVKEQAKTIPEKYFLSQNYPNPFNPTTIINYSIPVNGFVSLNVFNVLAQKVADLVNDKEPAGNYEISFDAQDLTSGIYFYRLSVISKAKSFTKTKKMILLK